MAHRSIANTQANPKKVARKSTKRHGSSGISTGLILGGIIFVVIALVGLMLLSNGSSGSNTSVVGPVRIGMVMPDFALKDLNGNTVRLSDYQGKPVLINAWATWCPPCRREMPDIHAFYQQHQDTGLVVLAVNVGETRDQAAGFAGKLGLSFPVLLDQDERLMDRLAIHDFPTSILVGRDGKVGAVHIGLFTPEQLDQELLPLLN